MMNTNELSISDLNCDSRTSTEQCWVLKIGHRVVRIVPQCQVIEPISRDKSTLYGGGGCKGQKNTEIVLFVLTLLATIVALEALHVKSSRIIFNLSHPSQSLLYFGPQVDK